MPHPTSTPRGLFAKNRFLVPASNGVMFEDYSTSTDLLTANSTALKTAGKIMIQGKAGGLLGANSTALALPGSITISAQTTKGLMSANSTALILPNSIRIGTKTTYLSSNSTGVKIGDLYISGNSTGNTTT